MPILEIEIVTRPAEVLRSDLAAEIADRAGEVFGSAPGATWVRVHALPAESYAENGGGPPAGVYPVFVSVLKSKLPDATGLEREARQLAETVGRTCSRHPENVHILYLPEGAGRVAFGGNVIR
jgi:phenylpyruvate tautomerase PptA (4-oxalocrotonate tautomerase family)